MKWRTVSLFVLGTLFTLLLAACTSVPPASQQPVPSTPGIITPPLDGTWEGTVNFPSQREKIVIHITTTDNGIEATMDVPRQDAYDLTLHDIQVELPKVHFEWSEAPSLGVLDGELGSDGRIAGKVTQRGGSGTFELVRQKAVSAGPQPPTPMPPGMAGGMVDVGGYKLYYKCIGQGSPTVILEAGGPADSTTWELVMTDYGETNRICAYDRANLGLSDEAPKPRTYLDMTRDLHALLVKAPIEGPCILVGHSMGGMLVRLFADQYPQDLVGLVLVDSAHPDMGDRLLANLPSESPGEPESLRAWRQYGAWLSASNGRGQNDDEGVDSKASNAQVRAVKSLGDLPLVVISRSPNNPVMAAHMPPLPEEINAKLLQTWQDLQVELAGLSSNSTRIIAANAGHNIQIEEPGLILDAIHKLVNEARSQ